MFDKVFHFSTSSFLCACPLHVLILRNFEACGSKQDIVDGCKEQTNTRDHLEYLHKNRLRVTLLVIVIQCLTNSSTELVLIVVNQLLV